MRDVPASVGGVPSRTLPLRASLFLLATFCLLALSVGAAHGGSGTPSRQAVPEQKATPEQQLKALQQKAEQGDAEAQFNLGVRYTNGNGVWQDYAKAAVWFRKAAEQGDAMAQTALGRAYAKGQGVDRDDVQAAAWYRKAADQGYADAHYDLAGMYATGAGVTKDDVEALKWANLAAVRASGDAPKVFCGQARQEDDPRSDRRCTEAGARVDAGI